MEALQGIIPYQELPGNYNAYFYKQVFFEIIPYQELPGNYNKMSSTIMTMLHYTIPRNTRELQHTMDTVKEMERLYHTKNYQGTTT